MCMSQPYPFLQPRGAQRYGQCTKWCMLHKPSVGFCIVVGGHQSSRVTSPSTKTELELEVVEKTNLEATVVSIPSA